ncbi:MAG: AMP-binding protein, partial [Acidiferrobacterales bacterium]
MVGANPYEVGLDRTEANYTPLSPLSFIERAAAVYPDHISIIHGDQRYTWRETYNRCRRLASALTKMEIGVGDTVAVMAPNTPAIYESHFGVPMCGAVLNALNVRLDAKTIAFILEHGGAKVLITDKEFSDAIEEALKHVKRKPRVIDIDDALATTGQLIGEMTYDTLLEEGTPDVAPRLPDDEWRAISLNYTSGTTGNPKGVVYHHR